MGVRPPPPGGCKYRVRSDSSDWPTLTRIAHFYAVDPVHFRAESWHNRTEQANQSARVIGERMDGSPLPPPEPERVKNPAAVALSKLGASKGGKARAESLSARKRKMIAKKAAAARWKH
jgi:hypothetical protein